MKDILLKEIHNMDEFIISGITYVRFLRDEIRKCKNAEGTTPAQEYTFKNNKGEHKHLFIYETEDNFVIENINPDLLRKSGDSLH